jgi:hypothetical protein
VRGKGVFLGKILMFSAECPNFENSNQSFKFAEKISYRGIFG